MARRTYPNGPVVFGTANEGGGTRKTTAAVNIGVELALRGNKVWVVDGDQTMRASSYLGYGVTSMKDYPRRTEQVYSRLREMTTVYDVVLGNAKLTDALVPARTRIVAPESDDDLSADDDDHFEEIPNLQLVLGAEAMSRASAAINDPNEKLCDDYWLRRAVEEIPQGTVDVIVFDCRGTFDTLEISELVGLDYLIGCVKPEPRDDDTLTKLHALIEVGRRKYQFAGGSAGLDHVLVNGYATNRGKLYIDVAKGIQSYYGDKTLPFITENVQIGESMGAQEPVYYWCGKDSRAAGEFAAVVDGLTLPDEIKRPKRK